jgi:signal transduction histidine kinase
LLILSVHHGIKQREQLEELTAQLAEANARLQELDKMKSEFVSIASHQLRSPLTAIRGYASMVLDGSCGKVSKDVKDAVGRVHEASGYMARSIEDYLNVSRIEAGNMHYEYERFDLKDAASKVVAELQPAAQERGLTLTFTSACTRECSVYADIGKVRQIIHNLVDNALKYTKEGSVIVTLEQVRNEEAAHISIKDTGVGMSSATIGGLFGKFVRTKDAQLINTSGAGLGLYIARKMMEEMGGSVTAESEGEGKGSTFHITVPLSKRGREAESMHAEQDTKTE